MRNNVLLQFDQSLWVERGIPKCDENIKEQYPEILCDDSNMKKQIQDIHQQLWSYFEYSTQKFKYIVTN